MKFNYTQIKENLRIYNETKKTLPIIEQYESGEISFQSMQKIGLGKFAQFSNFIQSLHKLNFNPQMAINWRELKLILIEHTKNERFKTWISRRTEKQFKKLIEQDPQTFDRLLNGRWISKPGYTNRGRKTWGRRSGEYLEGLDTCFVPIINWIISNDIEVSENWHSDLFKNFYTQSKYSSRIKWYLEVELNTNHIPKREIDITHNLLESVIEFVDSQQIDFRKLNCDFIIDTFNQKLRNLMQVNSGTKIRCISEFKNASNKTYLTIDKDYIVESTMVSNGFLRVLVVDDSGFRNWYEWQYFEDISFNRDLILSRLGI